MSSPLLPNSIADDTGEMAKLEERSKKGRPKRLSLENIFDLMY